MKRAVSVAWLCRSCAWERVSRGAQLTHHLVRHHTRARTWAGPCAHPSPRYPRGCWHDVGCRIRKWWWIAVMECEVGIRYTVLMTGTGIICLSCKKLAAYMSICHVSCLPRHKVSGTVTAVTRLPVTDLLVKVNLHQLEIWTNLRYSRDGFHWYYMRLVSGSTTLFPYCWLVKVNLLIKVSARTPRDL